MLNENIIKNSLDSKYKDADILVFDSVDSTNIVAKQKFTDKPVIVVSNYQTAGRGRLGRSFYSPKDTGIYMSIAVDADKVNNILSVTARTADGVCKALEDFGFNPQIKWVNDIYINFKKVCGILTEGIISETDNSIKGIVIGIGLNVSTKEFPKEIENIAASLESNLNRNAIIASIVNNVLNTVYSDNDDYICSYKKRSIVIGKEITCISANKKFTAIALDVDKNGALIVRLNDGAVKIINSGEISVRF